jgi:hypothetical protein
MLNRCCKILHWLTAHLGPGFDVSLIGHRQTGGLYNSPSVPQLCLQTLLWLGHCVGCQQPAPTEWSVNVWQSHGLPITVISHSLQLSVKHYPRCGSIKVRQLHYSGAGLCIPATSAISFLLLLQSTISQTLDICLSDHLMSCWAAFMSSCVASEKFQMCNT